MERGTTMNKLERKHLKHKHTRDKMLWVGFHTTSGTSHVKKPNSYRMKLEEEKLQLALKGEWK
jgi:hypothetical protein